jgi:hypothetical protein
MSKPRYTAVESQLMISPPRRSASSMPSALLPAAVGPRMASIGGPSTFETGALRAGRRMSVPEDDDADDEPEQDQQAELLRARRNDHGIT